jgi:serine/threonine-protein kinase
LPAQPPSRAYREVELAAQLAHPNIVRAYDADRIDDTYYFAMEYVRGTDLSKLVTDGGPLPVPRACEYARQAALGLEHIHANGLVHRDVKPSNLMVTPAPGPRALPDRGPTETVKILDLGVARIAEDPGDGVRRPVLTQLNAVVGTADFMAPEQARDSREADARSDLYSLGCTLYFTLTGLPPFPGGTPLEKMLRHQLDEPPAAESLRPEVTPLAAVLGKMMAKNPADRYQTAAEVAAALAPFAAPPTPVPGITVSPAPTNGPGPAPPVLVRMPDLFRDRDPGDSTSWLWLATISAVLGGVVVLFLILRLAVR